MNPALVVNALRVSKSVGANMTIKNPTRILRPHFLALATLCASDAVITVKPKKISRIPQRGMTIARTVSRTVPAKF